MWEIPRDSLKVELPEGFRLMEEPDFVHLLYGEDRVAIFSSTRVKPHEIEEAAQQYLIIKQS